MGLQADDGRYVVLDGMRGVAALAVVVFHGREMLGFQLLPSAYLSVDFFFGLSGFVIAHAYAQRLETGMGLADFLRRRAVRLYPLYAASGLCALAFVLLRVAVGRAEAGVIVDALPNLLLLPTPQLGLLFPLNFVAWSLLCEVIVNVVFAMQWRSGRMSWSKLLFIIGLTGAGLIGLAIAFGNLDIGPVGSNAVGGLGRAFASFAIGLLIHRLHTTYPIRAHRAIGPLLIVALGLTFAVTLHGIGRMVFDLTTVLLVYPLILFAGVCVQPVAWMGSTLSFLGTLSYAIYVMHLPVKTGVEIVLDQFGVPASALGLGLFVIVVIAVAFVMNRWFDVPVRHWLNGRQTRRLATLRSSPDSASPSA